ncbi:MAG: dTMP kinase [Parvularculaceae bacterium]|nr:dTMP kinase [Parvularculaceae bacterium]
MTGKGRGAFITFEGGDGVGKSTQMALLAERLRNAGHEVVTTREPGGSPGAEAIRELLVTGKPDRWSPLTEALLMYAARADHLQKTVNPARARGAVVLCDRFADSSMAYQGYAGGLGEGPVAALERLVVGTDGPSLTLILDAPAATGLARTSARGGAHRFEAKGVDYHERVRRGFLKIAAAHPERCAVIDASRSVAAVAADVAAAMHARLGLKV